MPDAAQLTELLTHYGYLAVLLGTFLEGETVLLIAGTLAHEGYLSLVGVGLCAFAGSLGSDQLMYVIGRRYGASFLAARPRLRKAADKVAPMMRRHDTTFILAFRFAYGLRNVAPMLIGMQGVAPRRFLLLNALGALLWAVLFCGLGYFVGSALETVFGRMDIRHHWLLFLLLLAAVAVALLAFRRRWKARRNRDGAA